MKKATSFCLSLAILLTLAAPAFAIEQDPIVNEIDLIDISHVAPEDRNAFVENYIHAHIVRSIQPHADDRYYYYYTEEDRQTVDVSGYADHQYEDGIYLDGDGHDGLLWIDSTNSSTVSEEVTFSVPYKIVTVTIKVGIAQGTSSGAVGIIKMATDGPGHYKIEVTREVEVRRVLIYRTDTRNGKTELWNEMYFQEETSSPIVKLDKVG